MKYLIIIPILTLSACATPAPDVKPSVPVQVHVLDERCATLAKYTKSVALLRDSGINQSDVPFLLPNSPAGLAVTLIQREVYSRADITPDVGQQNSYEVCRKIGYDTMSASLAEAERNQIMIDANNARKQITHRRTSGPKPKNAPK